MPNWGARRKRHDPKKAFTSRQTDRIANYVTSKGCRACGLRENTKLGIYDAGSLVRVPRSRYKEMDRGIMFSDLRENTHIYCAPCAKSAKVIG